MSAEFEKACSREQCDKAREQWWNALARQGDPRYSAKPFRSFNDGWQACAASLRTVVGLMEQSLHHPFCNYHNQAIGGVGCICVVTYQKRLNEAESAELERDKTTKLLPESFYGDRELSFRVERLVENWQRAVKVNQELELERDQVKEELQYVLNDWNALVKASGSRTNGGAIGHVNNMRLERDRMRDALVAAVPFLFEHGGHADKRCYRGSDDGCYCGLDEAKKLVETALAPQPAATQPIHEKDANCSPDEKGYIRCETCRLERFLARMDSSCCTRKFCKLSGDAIPELGATQPQEKK